MIELKNTFRRILTTSIASAAMLAVLSGPAAAVSDEDYFVSIYLAAQPQAAVQQGIDSVIGRGVPGDVAPELYRQTQVCDGKILFKHATRAEMTYLRTHNDAIRLRAGSGAPTPDILGIIQRATKGAEVHERAKCLWYEDDLERALAKSGSDIAIRDFKCRYIKDVDFECTYRLENTTGKNSEENKKALLRWNDGWSITHR